MVKLVGPVRPDTSWQAKAGEGYDISAFSIDWDARAVTCPQGHKSVDWIPGQDRWGTGVVHIGFARRTCLASGAGQHVWAYDFVEGCTQDERKLRMLNVVDKFTRECLCIRVGRKLGSFDIIDVLTDLFIARDTPGHIRSDNGPEFVAAAVKGWISGVSARTAFIEPGSPWENGCVESFNGKLREELA